MVPTPTSNSAAIRFQPRPSARSAAILRVSTITRGRPSLLPVAYAFLSPALTRSTIRLRSSSVTAPRTVKTIFPAGVEVPSDSLRDTKWTPRA